MSSFYGKFGLGAPLDEANALLDELSSASVAGAILTPFQTAAERQLAVSQVKKVLSDQQAEINSLKSQLRYCSQGAAPEQSTQTQPAAQSSGLNNLVFFGILAAIGYFAYRAWYPKK